jgi:hypothetical protein
LGDWDTTSLFEREVSDLFVAATSVPSLVGHGKLKHGLDFRTFDHIKAFRAVGGTKEARQRALQVCYFGALDWSSKFPNVSFGLFSPKWKENIVSQRLELFSILRERFSSELVVRTHPCEFRTNEFRKVVELHGLEFSTGAHEYDLHARMLIFDYPSTLFFAALEAGLPAFLVDSTITSLPMGTRLKDFFESLKSANVFFDSLKDFDFFLQFGGAYTDTERNTAERLAVFNKFFSSGCSPRDSVLASFKMSLI